MMRWILAGSLAMCMACAADNGAVSSGEIQQTQDPTPQEEPAPDPPAPDPTPPTTTPDPEPVLPDPPVTEESTPIPATPCQGNDDCESGWCVETADGRVCTRTCIDSCPSAWFCGPVSNTGTDVTFVCLPHFVTLCNPCNTDADCADSLAAGTSACLDYGDSGSFCGAECSEDKSECPEGYACEAGQCRLSAGECGCSWKAIKDATSTSCAQPGVHGTCYGKRSCIDGELSACDAAEPGPEICDLSDNDCDGLVDEELPLEPCAASGDAGTCTGVLLCEAGELSCTAQQPLSEICDGKDNDCDTVADEGFPDSDADGVADCISHDDDGDGIPDAADDCPLDFDPDQTDSDGDGAGDACDGDLDGDGDPNESDCAPADATIGMLATELCDALDNDCDGLEDEGFGDLDGDAIADCTDPDDDGDLTDDVNDNCPMTPNPEQFDTDLDGKGDACEDDLDGDGDPDATDCVPNDPIYHHGATEACNGDDENCNGIIDEGYPDTDGDGVANCLDGDDDSDGVDDLSDLCPLVADPEQLDTDSDAIGDACDTDDDGDATPDVIDCAPLDAAVNPNATEICNGGIDDDCDGVGDEEGADGCSEFLLDSDGDGFGVANLGKCLCAADFPYTATPGAADCDDQNGMVFPDAIEVCNGADDDCDAALDEGAAVGCQEAWSDADGDGFGTGEPSCVCPATPGMVSKAGDCNDADPATSPGASETCNGVDDDCDGSVDEANADGCAGFYVDSDGDGYGVAAPPACLCGPQGVLTALVAGDCDDGDAARFPSNPEECDLKDNNCNGEVDEGVKTTFFVDEDADGFGASYGTIAACEAPSGHVAKGGDCNDFNDAINPNAAEACNNIDDDCDGQADDGLALLTLYKDNDGDGFAAANAATWTKCDVPGGWTQSNDADTDGKLDWDCDDSDVTVFPTAPTVCGDGKDNDCDGFVDRLCYTQCEGAWPFQQEYVTGTPQAYAVDTNGDGDHEIFIRGSFGSAILTKAGEALYDYSAPKHNYSRGRPTFADIDGWDSHGPAIQTLEYLTGDGSKPKFYKIHQSGEVTVYDGAGGVYDASSFMVSDLDFDGQPEFVTSTWCESDAVEFWRFDRDTEQLFQAGAIQDPDGVCHYTNRRTLTDLDGDGVAEMVFGNGWPKNTAVNKWAGKVYAWQFTDFDSVQVQPWCEDCFDTTLDGLVGGAATNVLRIGDELRAHVVYFETDDPTLGNASTSRRWRYDPDGVVLDGYPTTESLWTHNTDIDDDGVPETQGGVAYLGMYDVDGDGYPDRIRSNGGALLLDLWDPVKHTWVANPGSDHLVSATSLAVRHMWDIDADGRIEVLSADAGGKIYCHELGASTWSRYTSLPPHFTLPNTTYQWDNYEPNDGADLDGDEIPDRISRIPSALTSRGDFYSYLSTPQDADHFLIDTSWGGKICLRSPPGRHYTMQIWSYKDRVGNDDLTGPPDGKPDALIWENTDAAQTKCWKGSNLVPNRHGEYRFVLGVKSGDGSHSPFWPYWIHAPK